MKKLKALQNEQAKLIAAAVKAADDGDVDLFEQLHQQAEDIKAQVAKLEDLEARAADLTASMSATESAGDVEFVATTTQSSIGNVRDSWQDDPAVGFKNQTDFLMSVYNVSVGKSEPTPQLKFLQAAGSDEHSTLSDSHGGFLLPEAFSPNVRTLDIESDPTMGLVTSFPMAAQVVNINARVDKDHSTSVSGGLTVGRTTETQSPSSSRMQMEKIKMEATALTGLTYASEQLLERSPISFIALLERGFQDEFASTMLDEKLNGTGAGSPVGILNSPATITVGKETGQAADTIVGANISKMRARCWRYGSAIWLANHDCYDQLSVAHRSLTNDDVPVFVPGNGVDVPDTLLGRPIYFTEHTKTVGDAGDIILGNWSQYLWGTLGSTRPRRAESIHVRFLNHERTFKFWIENCGAPWWRSPLTPKNGANTLAPFVVLAVRA